MKQNLSVVILAVSILMICLVQAGCKDPCVQLWEKICECKPTRSERDTCNQDVSLVTAHVDVTDDDNKRCDSLLDKCDCNTINTDEGKLNCGLARSKDLSY